MALNPKTLSGDGGLEFQSPDDDAWYDVELAVREDALIVKCSDISDAPLKTFTAEDFKCIKELENFINKRFRPISAQLQDYQCHRVVKGMTVTASFQFGPDEVMFHDAVVEKVEFKDHSYEGGEEVCTCRFLLSWLNGQNYGTKTLSSVENICLIQSGNVLEDPTIDLFLKVSREKFKVIEQDIDLGGKCNLTEDLTAAGSCHYLLIENLEKDLSSATIVDFVKNHVSISSEVQILPSLSSESCTRGFIIVESLEKLQKLADFLLDPAHIVSSSRGRPWVITEKKLRRGAVGTTLGNLTVFSKSSSRDENRGIGDKIEIFSIGTEEYQRCKQFRKLFLQFADNQWRLHQRLALAENKILETPSSP